MPGDLFYSSAAWFELRLKALARARWRCEMCGESLRGKGAAHVDHKLPRRLRPDLALTLDNLQVLCAFHHNGVKQAIEANADRPAINAQGFPAGWAE